MRHYVSGLIAEQIPKIHHKSLAPLGGSTMWDGIFSFCPLFGFLRFAFNPMLLGSGEVESEVSYSNSPSFFLCISLEHLNYHYLLPAGLFIESLNYICSRWIIGIHYRHIHKKRTEVFFKFHWAVLTVSSSDSSATQTHSHDDWWKKSIFKFVSYFLFY